MALYHFITPSHGSFTKFSATLALPMHATPPKRFTFERLEKLLPRSFSGAEKECVSRYSNACIVFDIPARERLIKITHRPNHFSKVNPVSAC